jgi:branched-chain amino acid transport system ATP-binding protein
VTALELSLVTKSFSGLKVIDELSMQIASGERRLIIGPNGAGKTTLFNLIAGEYRVDGGRIEVLGHDLTRAPARRRAHIGVARTYQIITLFAENSLRDNVALALLGLRPLRWNMLSQLAGQATLLRKADAVLARVGLEAFATRPLREVAYGEQRRVEIAMALAQEPKLLLLDEPFAGLSMSERAEVASLLASIPDDVTIVMIEHDMDVALEFAERISVMHFGQIAVEGERAEVVADPRTREIYLGD